MTMSKQTETQNVKLESHTAQRLAGLFFGLVEVLLVFRLVFKLLAANASNVFVSGLYTVSHFFVGIFEGIFQRVAASGNGAGAVFEPATLIAIVVFALIAWGVLIMIKPRKGAISEKTEYTEHKSQTK